MRYAVTVLFDASRSVSVEADTPEEAEEKAHQEIGSASLCHHCANEINMGDATGALVYEDDGDGDQVLDTTYHAEVVARLEAEVAALKVDKEMLDWLCQAPCGSVQIGEHGLHWGRSIGVPTFRDAILKTMTKKGTTT